VHVEGGASDENDHGLAANNNELYAHEPIIAEHAFKDIKSVV
jgi:hypothetical protein